MVFFFSAARAYNIVQIMPEIQHVWFFHFGFFSGLIVRKTRVYWKIEEVFLLQTGKFFHTY